MSLWPEGQNFNNSSDWKSLSPVQSCFYTLCENNIFIIYLFFHFSLSVRKSPSYIWTHSWLDIDCFIGKRQSGENPLITFKLFSFIASCWKRADGGIKKEKVDYACVSSSCNDPPHTYTSPPVRGSPSSQDSGSNQRGHRHLTNHTSN